jgi:hypothetical protein
MLRMVAESAIYFDEGVLTKEMATNVFPKLDAFHFIVTWHYCSLLHYFFVAAIPIAFAYPCQPR